MLTVQGVVDRVGPTLLRAVTPIAYAVPSTSPPTVAVVAAAAAVTLTFVFCTVAVSV